jgi:hypothetical protein
MLYNCPADPKSILTCFVFINLGDYLLCYLTGISQFVGILEVKSKCYTDATLVWLDEIFPIRFGVQLVEKLDAKTAVPVLSLKMSFSYSSGSSPETPGPASSADLQPSFIQAMARQLPVP